MEWVIRHYNIEAFDLVLDQTHSLLIPRISVVYRVCAFHSSIRSQGSVAYVALPPLFNFFFRLEPFNVGWTIMVTAITCHVWGF